MSIDYWLLRYVYIFNATDGDWVRFELWPAQADALKQLRREYQSVVLKARQLGLSWLVICYALHLMLFKPAATILMFSKRDEEAIELLARLKGVYERLPRWMQARKLNQDSLHDFELSNDSSAKSFPSTGGRSYTGSLVIVDEADFVQDLDKLINAVKPTIDAGGQMIMISTVDKSLPESPFKRVYRAAQAGQTDWRAIFLPWHARPGRTAAWYAAQTADIMARTGALDDLHQEYPNSPSEALAPRSLDKRIPAPWLELCYVDLPTLDDPHAPAIPSLELYALPVPGRRYVLGADPAEGNPTSDDSAATVLDLYSGEEMAAIAGKFEPDVFAGYCDQLGRYFNQAALMVERNNHGHTVLLWWREHSTLPRLRGYDSKFGWLSNSLGKTLLYTEMATAFRDEETILHSMASYMQLASIEGATLLAPKGQKDDRADSYALAHVGRAALLKLDSAQDDEIPATSSRPAYR